MKSLMMLTSLLLIETLSHSDYIMVNVANTRCTDGVVPASSSLRKSVEHCIATNLNVTLMNITVCPAYEMFNRLIGS